MTDAEFRRGLFLIAGLALVLPPSSGMVVMSFVGFVPFPEVLYVFFTRSAVYVIGAGVIAFWWVARYARSVVSGANSSFSDRQIRRLRHTPWLLLGVLTLYFMGGVWSSVASLEVQGHREYSAAEVIYGFFTVIPALVITALPLLFLLSDHLERYLAPRGVRANIASMRMRLTVLGLFTPVMIDSLLISYYFDRTRFFAAETFALWLGLIAIAAAGTLMVWVSFRRSLDPVETYLSDSGCMGDASAADILPVPGSLDEIGEIISRWREDVQNKRTAEEELRESERRLQHAMGIAKLGYYIWDFETGRHIFCTEEFAALHGMTVDEYMSEYSSEEMDLTLVHPDDRERYLNALSKRQKTRDPIIVEYRIVGKDGVTRYVREVDTPPSWREDEPNLMEGVLLDITDYKTQEQDLRQKEERLVNAQRIARIGDFSWDLRTNVVRRSDNVYRIWGLTPEQVENCPEAYLEIVHPEDRLMVSDALNGAYEGKPYSIDYRIVHPSGEEHYFHEQAEIGYDDAGQPVKVSGTIQDVTERRVVENEVRRLNETLENRVEQRTRELAEEKQRAEEYLNVAAAIIVAIDSDGKIGLINGSGCRMLGYTREELIGKDWFDTCVPPEERETVREALVRVLDGKIREVANYENTVISKSGERRVISWHDSPIKLDGRIVGTLSSGEDVTERLQAEEALRRSEHESRLVADTLPMGLVYLSKDLTYRRVNPAYASWFGKTPEEMVGLRVRDIIGDQSMSEMSRFFDAVLNGEKVEYERTLHYGDTHLELDGIMVPYVGGNGEIDGILTVALDVTEKKRAEEQLRHAQKMEALGHLAGGVAHNLNNLLVPIVGLSRMSADDLPEGSTKREVLERIHGASERAQDTVARILAFSRQEKPSFERLDLKSLVQDALALAEAGVPFNIALSSDLDDATAFVDADKVQIESLFLNIVNNAIAAIGKEDGGEIEVCLKRERVGPRQALRIDPDLRPGSYAVLAVKDNGPGMDDYTKTHIFDPFFTTKEVGEGTGLGLSMAHGIIREHRGAIMVESQLGQGTRFTIYLPLLEARNETSLGME
ncbi:MAG: PAS domain S-box protein [Thalassovita sp.]|nr:PAS domain S-box protein [Thalassovita sp.]